MTRVGRAALLTLCLAGAACSTGDGSTPGGSRGTTSSTAAAGATTTTAPPVSVQISAAPWSLPSARDREVALVDGSNLWLLGGRDPGKSSRTSVLEIDPATGTATPAGELPVAVHDAAGARLGGRLVVFGGGNSATIATVQAFTPGGSGAVIGALPRPRSDPSGTTVGGRAVIVGGFDGSTMTPDVLETTDGVTFTTVAALPVPVRYAAVAARRDKVYVFGGVTDTGESATTETAAIQEVDLTTRSARIVAQMPQPLGHSTAVTLGDQVLVLGGRSAGSVTAQVWRFDPATTAFLPVGTLPVPVSDSAAAIVGGVAYLLGGEGADAAPTASVATLRPG